MRSLKLAGLALIAAALTGCQTTKTPVQSNLEDYSVENPPALTLSLPDLAGRAWDAEKQEYFTAKENLPRPLASYRRSAPVESPISQFITEDGDVIYPVILVNY